VVYLSTAEAPCSGGPIGPGAPETVGDPDSRRQFIHSRIARRQITIRNMKELERPYVQIDAFRHSDLKTEGRLHV
jgi:hypothetical protein